MSGPDYVGHRLIIYTGQFALVNLMGGVKVDDGLEGVQDENHKTQIMAEISICLLVFCTRNQKPAHHFENLQMKKKKKKKCVIGFIFYRWIFWGGLFIFLFVPSR